jgi:hypothetical protein
MLGADAGATVVGVLLLWSLLRLREAGSEKQEDGKTGSF